MRKPRYYYVTSFYHIMVQGDEKKFIFSNDECKRKIIDLLKKNTKRNNIKLISYCIMGNHYHALLYVPKIVNLSRMMCQTNTAYGKYYSKLRNNVGHVFRDRFRSESIYTKEHLLNCIKYIHANPVKANMCYAEEDYNYSSYNEFKNIGLDVINLCDLSAEDIKNILDASPTITMFIDYEYDLKDVVNYYNEISKEYDYIIDKNKKTALLYEDIKKNCRATDTIIAKLMKIDRKTLLRRLKNYGVKK